MSLRDGYSRGAATGTALPASVRTEIAVVGVLLGTAAAVVSVRSPIYSAYINFSALLVAAAVLVALITAKPGDVAGLRITMVDVSLGLYILWRVTAEIVDASDLGTEFARNSLLDIFVAAAAYFAVRIVVSDAAEMWSLLRWLALPAAPVSLIAIGQLLDLPGLNDALTTYVNSGGLQARIDGGWALRGTSTIGHWTALGGYLAAAVAIACGRMIFLRENGERITWWTTAFLLVLLFGQIATLTFATVALTVAIVLVTAYRLRLGVSVLLTGVLIGVTTWVVAGVALGERVEKQISGNASSDGSSYWYLPESVGFRVNVWVNETIPAVLERPVAGWGIAAYRYVGTGETSTKLRWISPESEWLRTAVASGVPGLLFQILLLCAIAVVSVGAIRRLSGSSAGPIAVFFFGIIIASFIHSHLTNRGVPLMLWPMVGCFVALYVANLKPTALPGGSLASARGFEKGER